MPAERSTCEACGFAGEPGERRLPYCSRCGWPRDGSPTAEAPARCAACRAPLGSDGPHYCTRCGWPRDEGVFRRRLGRGWRWAKVTKMTCAVCNQTYDATDADRSYCAQCGWSLGQLFAQFDPESIVLAGARKVPVRLVCGNHGHGWLECHLGPLPPGVSLAAGARESLVLGREPGEIRLEIDPAGVEERAAELTLEVWANDARGRHARDFRPAALGAGRRKHRVRAPLLRRRLGPVQYTQELLLFRTGQREQLLRLENQGEVPLCAQITAGSGFQVGQGDGALAESMTMTLPPGEPVELTVEAAPAAPGRRRAVGSLRVEIPDLPGDSRDVTLCWLPGESLKANRQRWMIGIDFGTAKTAIFIADGHQPQAEPQPVRWQKGPAGGGSRRLSVPSVINYPDGRSMPQFGWEVPQTAERIPGSLVIRSIKKRLIEDETYRARESKQKRQVTTRQAVTDYLRFLFEAVRRQEQFGDQDPFDDALVIMGLPVRDQDGQYELQRRVTAEAAKEAGLEVEPIFFPEPECAAVDFLRRRNELGMTVQDGELICVFDCGAGTTDISVLQVHLSGGEVGFTRCALAGFPFGGDVVDELLTRHALEKLREAGLLEEYNPPDEQFRLKGDSTPYDRSGRLQDIRLRKEQLPVREQPAPEGTDVPQIWLIEEPEKARVPLTWELIEELFAPTAVSMLERGFKESDMIPRWPQDQPVGVPLPSLTQALWDARISPSDIRWLCLTGGSSFIPCLVAMLRRLLPHARVIPDPATLPDPSPAKESPFTLNVAQGAASRPLFRVDGLLPAALSLRFDAPTARSEERALLEAGAVPGQKSSQQMFVLGAEECGTLRLMACVGETRGAVYVLPVSNPDPQQPAHLLAQVEYGSDRLIYLTVRRAIGPEETVVLPRTPVVP